MLLTNLAVSLGIMMVVIFQMTEMTNHSVKITKTNQVKLDIDTFTYNARNKDPDPVCLQDFCFKEFVEIDNQRYMIYEIKAEVYGSKMVRRLASKEPSCKEHTTEVINGKDSEGNPTHTTQITNTK